MNQKIKRILAFLLCLATVLSIAACKPKTNDPSGPNGNGNGNGAGTPGASIGNKQKPQNVWRETAISIPNDLTDAYGMKMVGDIAYFPTSTWDYETYKNTMSISTFNLATGELGSILSIEGLESDYENQIYQNLSISTMCPLSDGSVWVVEEYYRDDYSDPNNYISDRTTTLKRFTVDGELIAEIDAYEFFPDSQYIWIYRMETDAQDNLYILFESNITIVSSETNALLATIKSENGNYINSLVPMADGSVGAVVSSETSSGSKLRRIDLAAKAFSAASVDLAPEASYVDGAVRGEGDVEFYFLRYGAGIFGAKKDGTVVEVVNFLNSNINSDNINTIHRLPNDEFLMIWYDYEAYETTRPDDGGYVNALRFSRLTRVPDDEIKEAIMITYACMWLDYETKRAILKFNKSSEDYRIIVDDYSRFQTNDDWRAGYTRLATDIITGKIPDIINVDSINIQPFVKKGMLADLYKLMDASPNHNREDYVQSVLKAAEINGGLYSFTPSFSIFTVAGKKSIVGDVQGWTIDDLNALMATLPEGTSSFDNMSLTKSDILNMSLTLGMSQYIDWDTATVSFGDNFIKLLEFANTFPTEINYDDLFRDDTSYMHWRDRYQENRAILEQSYVYGYRTVRELSEYTFGEEVSFVGFPSEDRQGSLFMPNYQFAISGKSSDDVQEICFEFLMSLVQTEPNFDNAGGYFYSNFSIDKGYNDAVRAYELLPMRERPGFVSPQDYYDDLIGDAKPRATVSVEPMPMPEPGGDGEYDPYAYERNYPLTQAEIDAIDDLINNTKRFYYYDEGAMVIITEETDAYFAGRKSAAEATRLIQSRVQLYVSEQS